MAIDPTLMRTRPQWQKWYLAVDKPPIIWRGRVKGDHTRGAYDIVFDGGALVGAITPEVDFEIWFGSTVDQKDIGISRIRNGALPGAWDTGTFRIASNDMDLADNDYITVKQNIRPTAILPSIDGVYEDEDKAYDDENENQHPLARIGPPAAGFLSNGILTVDFRSDDEAIASGALPDTYDWQFEDGDQSSAVANPGNINFTTTGRKWVTHTVTDDQVPAKSHTRYSQVYVFDTSAPPITGFQVSNLSGDRDSGGWRATVTVHQDADIDEFPDLAQVVIFCEAYWGGTQSDVGYGWVGRENIMFVGYIVEDSVTKDPETSVVTFDVISIVELMKQITCWGASLKDDVTPIAWHEIKDMNLNLEAFHVFTEHTTIDKIADIYLHLYYDDVYGESPTEVTMKYTDLGEGSVYDQVKTQIGEAGRALLLNNKYGQIYLEPNAQLALSTNMPTDIMWTLDHDDWRDKLDLGPELDGTYQCCQVDFIGFYYSGNDPLPWGSLAPGRQWPTGSVQKVTGVRVNNQTDADKYSGVFEQNYNNEFSNVATGMAGFYPVLDIAPQRYLAITLAATDTLRGLVWSAINHIPKNVSFTINGEGGYALTNIVLDQAIGSATGVTNKIPTVDPNPDPPPAPEPPPLPPPPIILPGDIIIYDRSHILMTEDFGSDNPTWRDVKGAVAGVIWSVHADINDGTGCWAVTGTDNVDDNDTGSGVGIWYCPDIYNVAPAWGLIASQADCAALSYDALANPDGGADLLQKHWGQIRSLCPWAAGEAVVAEAKWHGYNNRTASCVLSITSGGVLENRTMSYTDCESGVNQQARQCADRIDCHPLDGYTLCAYWCHQYAYRGCHQLNTLAGLLNMAGNYYRITSTRYCQPLAPCPTEEAYLNNTTQPYTGATFAYKNTYGGKHLVEGYMTVEGSIDGGDGVLINSDGAIVQSDLFGGYSFVPISLSDSGLYWCLYSDRVDAANEVIKDNVSLGIYSEDLFGVAGDAGRIGYIAAWAQEDTDGLIILRKDKPHVSQTTWSVVYWWDGDDVYDKTGNIADIITRWAGTGIRSDAAQNWAYNFDNVGITTFDKHLP